MASSCQNVETVRNGLLGNSASQSVEVGIVAAEQSRQQARWLAENQNALDSSNAYVERHGLPLVSYRRF